MDDRDKKMILRETVKAAKSAGIPISMIGRSKETFADLVPDKLLIFVYSDIGHWLSTGYTFIIDSPSPSDKFVKELSCAIAINGIMQTSARGSANILTCAKTVSFSYFKTMADGLQTRAQIVKDLIGPKVVYISDIDILSDNIQSPSWQNVACTFDSMLISRINQGKVTILSLSKPMYNYIDSQSRTDEGTQAFGATFKDVLDTTSKLANVYEEQKYCRISLNGKK